MLNADLKGFEFTSSFDELVISAVIAVPSENVCGVVQLVHGMNEHKELYYPFMDYLAGEGFITVINDSRGHGKSVREGEEPGSLRRDGSEGLVSDIAQLTRIVRETYPDLPYFLVGSGIGALGARCFLREHDDMIDGLVEIGCPCYSGFSTIVRTIEAEAAKDPEGASRSQKAHDIFDTVLSKKFKGASQPNAWRNSDEKALAEFNADPLCDITYVVGGYKDIIWLLRESYSRHGWKVKNPSLPIRFVSGRDDTCMISEKKFLKGMRRLEKSGYENISHRLFDGMRHDILREQGSINVYKDIAKTLFSWIDRRNAMADDTQE